MIIWLAACGAFPEYAEDQADVDDTHRADDDTASLVDETGTSPDDIGNDDKGGGATLQVATAYRSRCVIDAGSLSCIQGEDEEPLAPPSGTFTSVDGWGHDYCALRSSGEVVCFDNDPEDEPLEPPSGTFVQITVGQGYGCGIHEGGDPECWGEDVDGNTHAPPVQFERLAAGVENTCGIRQDDATLVCWGEDFYEIIDEMPEEAVLDVAVSKDHACAALAEQGGIVCWGTDFSFGLSEAPDPKLTGFVEVASNHARPARARRAATSCAGAENTAT